MIDTDSGHSDSSLRTPLKAVRATGEGAQYEQEPTWVLLSRPGMAAVRKGPFQEAKHVEQMVRDLYELHPDATCIVIDAPHTTYPTDGREWVAMYGDRRRRPIPRAALSAKPGPCSTLSGAQGQDDQFGAPHG